MACALFNICLSIFLGQPSSIGRVIALDEAHRYMGDSSECDAFTNSLLAAIRVQRHVGARIIISTQEPTISPKLLDLCSITVVHRFSSPDWLSVLTKHLAGISKLSQVTRAVDAANGDADEDEDEDDRGAALSQRMRSLDISKGDPILDLFAKIVMLRTGEALVFAPSAVVSLESQDPNGGVKAVPRKLAHNVLRVVVRDRITRDGGQSILAS